MNDKKQIKTFKQVYPQIYSYTLPNRSDNDGWQKIGYTEREDVDKRIREQVRTPGLHEEYKKLWSAPAIFEPVEKFNFFDDHKLHKYMVKNGIRKDEGRGKEWFYFNGTPEKSKELFDSFRRRDFSIIQHGQKYKYTLRHEQNAAVEKTLEYAKRHQTIDFNNPNEEAEFLWNAKPRFGKTLTTYDFAKRFEAKNILIVTNRPAIANSWFDDYKKFIDGYYFISTADSLKNLPTLTREDYLQMTDTDKKQFTFLSLQDLKGAKVFGGGYDKLKWVADLQWDLLVIDEAHEGIDTGRTDEAFSNIKRRFTLHLSGTPFRALRNDKFTQEQIFNWTYIDEQKAKQSELKTGESGDHTDMPDMRLFTYKISDMIADKINQGVKIDDKDTSYAFDLNSTFATAAGGKFIYEADIKRFLDTLTTNEKYPFSTPELRAELKHTFWLVGNRVASAKAMYKLLKDHPVFGNGNYKIILAAGDGKPFSDDNGFDEEVKNTAQNEKALDRVRSAIKHHDKTITLSVGQLTTGVTVKEWSAVLMLSDIKAESLYMQAIFRVQNPYVFEKNGHYFRKKSAYVFDFSPNRVLEVYDHFANSLLHTGATGHITEEERFDNIAELLNYFPVLSEDEGGKMIELDATQVLTFPKAIMAREVVEHRFITNLLFKNINNVYNIPSEIRKRINKLADTNEQGKVTTSNKDELSDNTDRRERTQKRITANRNVVFGEKVYGNEIQNIIDDNLADGAPEPGFTNNITSEIQQKITEPIYAKYIETYSPSKSEVEQLKKKHQEKIKLIAEDFVDSQQTTSDQRRMADAIATLIEEDMPRDMVDEREEKEFQNEEKTDMDIIKSKLKTFSRAIPSFVMAASDPANLTIDNIENAVSDADFEELFTETQKSGSYEPFTKDDFRLLRDGGDFEENGEIKHFDGFFEKYVFNAAIQEFEKKRSELQDYLRTTAHEDIFTYIPPQKSNQIFTPRKVVNQMLNILEKENPGIFENPNLTFADLYVKSGLYLTEIAKRLYRGLKSQIPDENARLKHIFERQLYGFAPTQIIHDIAENYIYRGFDNISHDNLKLKDLTPDFKEGIIGNMKFDVVIGNPPYQENDNGKRDDGSANASASPIYHNFIENAERISDMQCFVIPSRWAMGAGKGLKKFTEKMMEDKDIQAFHYFTNPKDVFPDNDIKGGICYFVRKVGHNAPACISVYNDEGIFESERYLNSNGTGIFIPYAELASILEKVQNRTIDLENYNIQKIVSVLKPYGLRTDFLKNQSKYGLPPVQKERLKDDDLEIFGLGAGNKRISRFMPKDYPLPAGRGAVHCWKVFVPYAYGCGAIGEEIPSPILGSPIQICTETYLRIGKLKTEDEAKALLKYLKCKFFRAMVGVLKTTQHSTTTFKFVPLQNFTLQSDIDWSKSIAEIDQQLYKKYGLSEKEIAFIETKVRAME